jgi:hypothetical protein
MKKALLAASLIALATPAYAQFSMPTLPSAPSVPSLSAPSLPSIPSLSDLPSLSSASPGNIAGLLQYCLQNNDLSGDSATSVPSMQSQLLGQANETTASPDYSSGSSGVLDAGNQAYSLANGGAQSAVTQQICNQALSRAKSML